MKYFHQSFQRVWLEVQNRLKGTYNFSKKSFSPQIVPLDCIFDKSAEIFLPKVRNVFAQNRKILKSFVLLSKQFSHNLFAWTPSLHFWQTSQKFSDKGWIFFAGKVGKSRKENSFCQKPLSKRSSADVTCNSQNPAKIFLSEVLKSFAQSLSNEINTFKFPEKRLLSNCSSAVVAVWQPYQNLSGKSWFVLCSKYKGHEEDVFFPKKPQKIFLESLNSVLITFWILCREYEIFLL